MKELLDYYPFQLNEEQKKLLRELIDFFDSEDRIFILKGYAGTGKTSIILGLVKYLGENKKPFMLMASTGRASKVLAEKARYPASTVHSAIYMLQIIEKRKKGGDTEYRIAFRQRQPNPITGTIYFVDESSMISNRTQTEGNMVFGSGRLLDDFFNFTNGGKIVFIGDPAQLPPVNARFSAALNKSFLSQNFSPNVREFTLTQVMRYKKNSGIYYNTTRLRETISSGRYPLLSVKTGGFDDIVTYYHDNDLIKAYFKTIIKKGVDSTIYITFTNKAAALANKKVRIHLWGVAGARTLHVDESLMVARNNYLYGLNNGDLITVDDIEDKITVKAGLSFRYIIIRVTDPDPSKGMILKRVLIINDLLDTDSRDLSAEQDMELLSNYFGRMHHIAGELYEIMLELQRLEKEKFQEYINKEAVKRGVTVNTQNMPEKIPSKKAFFKALARGNMQTDPYLNALRVKYGYAVTCHKAQGSEWQDVFVQFERPLSVLDNESLYRWTYTALSRAEKKLHLLKSNYSY